MTTLQHIASLAAQAGEIILHNTQAPVHRKEGHYNFVTVADTAVQTFLTERLRDVLPAARFFCEEQENDALGNEPTFIIDPIDGTCNFMRGRGCSAVSIALTEGRRPVLGVVCNPYRGETFTAELGKGTHLNGHPYGFRTCPLKTRGSPWALRPITVNWLKKPSAPPHFFSTAQATCAGQGPPPSTLPTCAAAVPTYFLNTVFPRGTLLPARCWFRKRAAFSALSTGRVSRRTMAVLLPRWHATPAARRKPCAF